jgi:hypothetical protein
MIMRVFFNLGKVTSVRLYQLLNTSGGYAEVELDRGIIIEPLPVSLKDAQIDGYHIFITTDQSYTRIRNDIAELLSGTVEENIKITDNLLSVVFLTFGSKYKRILRSKELFLEKLNLALEKGKEINKETLILVASSLLTEKKLELKEKKIHGSVFSISTPMGGQSHGKR